MAEPLLIPGTRSTPMILLDPAKGQFVVAGNSLPENALEFYGRVLRWMEANHTSIPPRSVFIFRLPYFNTSSMKTLYMILERLQRSEQANPRGIALEWQVEDDDEFMIEAGQNFALLLDLPLRHVHLSAAAIQKENEALNVAIIRRTAA